jgi:hypothetical protein
MSIFRDEVITKTTNPFTNTGLSQKELYKKLWDYYNNNSLYGNLQAVSRELGQWIEPIKGLATVTNRSTEFYVSKIISGSLAVTAKNDVVKTSIEQVWKWSNFDSQKQVFSRFISLTGNLFVKVANDESKVFFNMIDPENVTDFEVDSRNYLTKIRIDVPIVQDEKNLTYTEYWDKTDGYFAVWIHNQGENAKLEQLGDPTDYATLAELGISFIPIVFIKFKDIGKKYGVGCTNHALDKIDEINRQRTRLHQLMFRWNKETLIISDNSVDANGRAKVNNSLNDDDLDLLGNDILQMAGSKNVSSLIPEIDWKSHLDTIVAMGFELEQDLPELKYYSLKDQLSGQAVKQMLGGAVSRAEEARSNMLSGIIRMDEIALTVGIANNIFPAFGNYENGDFEHSIQAQEMFPVDNAEIATLVKTYTESGLSVQTALRFAGFSETEIKQAMSEKDSQDQKVADRSNQNLANAMQSFNTGV